MDQRAAEFAAQLMSTFNVEAQEHLKSLFDSLLALEGGVSEDKRAELVETIFREAHSLKGAARAVDLVKIQDVCQSMENILSDLKYGKIQLTADLFEALYSTVDLIGKCIQDPQAEILGQLQMLAHKLEEARELKGGPQPITPTSEGKAISVTHKLDTSEPSLKTIRVDVSKLDPLMQEIEEFLLIKLITAQRHARLKQLSNQMTIWERDWSRVQKDLREMRQAKEGGDKGYRPTQEFLEFIERQPVKLKEMRGDLHEMTKVAAQDTRLVGSMVDGLLEDARKVLMQPFGSLFDIFPRMVRDISHSLDKKIALTSTGSEIEVDRRILEEMKDPLIHLLRNSIDHGIESPAEREVARKLPQGEIKLSATQKSGNLVEICLTDNGKGINVQDIKNSAIKKGLISQKEADELSFQEALMLIFKSGLSTSPIITELSGRGLGLGIVLEKVEKLGGQLKVESKAGEGTAFRITLPLTLATFRGLHITANGQDFIFPTHNLIKVLRMTEEAIQTVEGKGTFNLSGRILSYVHLGAMLRLAKPEKKAKDKFLYVLVIKAMDITVAIGVDAILNEQQVFVKGLGGQLMSVKNIAAATVMEWGKVVPILDPFDLVKTVGENSENISSPSEREAVSKKKNILIAEDSVTARVLLKNILETAGFNVKTAVDGTEALSVIKIEDIQLLLSDVDMPRMDGFKLTESVRAIEKFKDLPIILCTSRGSREDREHGIEVGANAYIDKSSFTQSYLLEIIQKFF